jgi:hypothetical protein
LRLFVAQFPAHRHPKIVRGFCKCARLQWFGTRAYQVCTAVQREGIVMRYSLERAWGSLKLSHTVERHS